MLIILKNEKKNYANWANATKAMNPPATFLESVKAFDKNNIDEWKLALLAPILKNPDFVFDIMVKKS